MLEQSTGLKKNNVRFDLVDSLDKLLDGTGLSIPSLLAWHKSESWEQF